MADETGGRLPTAYVPDPGTYSTFLYKRFRPEFEPALQAWLAEDPGTNPSAPSSPFVMPEYTLRPPRQSAALEKAADASAAQAREATARAGQLRARHRPVRLGAVLLRHRSQAELTGAARGDGRLRRRAPAHHARRPGHVPRAASATSSRSPGRREARRTSSGPRVASVYVRRRGRSRARRRRSCARRSSWSSPRRRPAHPRRRRRSRRPRRGRWRAGSSRPG